MVIRSLVRPYGWRTLVPLTRLVNRYDCGLNHVSTIQKRFLAIFTPDNVAARLKRPPDRILEGLIMHRS